MTPVMQTKTKAGYGNCNQAVVASMLDLPLSEVPDFISMGVGWSAPWMDFHEARGWEYNGAAHLKSVAVNTLREEDSINGLFHAVVPSLNNAGGTHSVVIDNYGVVVHDPHPEKEYLGRDVFGCGDGVILSWYTFRKVAA